MMNNTRSVGSLYPEWQTEHPPEPPIAPQIKQMYNAYGRTPGEKCKNCVYLERIPGHTKTYFKCKLTKQTNGPATDWRLHWEACGKWVMNNRQSDLP